MANIRQEGEKMPDPRIFPIERVDDDGEDVVDVSALILAANDQRADLEIVCDGDYDVWVGRDNAAVVGEGIFLVHKGGSYTMNTQNLFLGEFYAICDEGEDSHLTISEGEWQ